jgi:hypothetical protein
MEPEDELYRVTMPYYCCGFLVRNLRGVLTITEAAPIMKWATGKPLAVFVGWVKAKGGKVERV